MFNQISYLLSDLCGSIKAVDKSVKISNVAKFQLKIIAAYSI